MSQTWFKHEQNQTSINQISYQDTQQDNCGTKSTEVSKYKNKAQPTHTKSNSMTNLRHRSQFFFRTDNQWFQVTYFQRQTVQLKKTTHWNNIKAAFPKLSPLDPKGRTPRSPPQHYTADSNHQSLMIIWNRCAVIEQKPKRAPSLGNPVWVSSLPYQPCLPCVS